MLENCPHSLFPSSMIRLICLTLFNDISRRRLVTLDRIEKLNLQESDRVVVNI